MSAQTEGDTWVTGYNTSPGIDTSFGFAYWLFESGDLVIEYELDMLGSLEETNASFSSEGGEVLMMTNGMEIFTPSGDRIIDTIAYLMGGENWDAHYSTQRNIERYHTLQITILYVNGGVIAAPELPCSCRLKLGSIPAGVYF